MTNQELSVLKNTIEQMASDAEDRGERDFCIRLTVDDAFALCKLKPVSPAAHGRWLKPFWATGRQRQELEALRKGVAEVSRAADSVLPSNKALTNADRIRAATNQQLAKLLYDNQKEFCRLMYKNLGFEDELNFSGDYSDILAWLNAPIEGNGESIGGDEGCLT